MGKNYHKPDVFSTIEPLNHVLKAVGLSSIARYEGKIQYSWSSSKIVLIICFLFIANICNTYVKLQNVTTPGVFNFNNSIQLFETFGYFQYIIGVYFVYKHRRDYLEYYSTYEYIDKVLGEPRYEEIRRSILQICSLYIFISVLTTLEDLIACIMNAGWIKSTVYVLDNVYVTFKVINALDMISHAIQFLFRLKMIGNALEVLYKRNDFKLGGLNAAKQINRLDNLKIVCYNHCDVILWLKRCYLLLLEQRDFFNSAYGFRILANNFMFLFDMVMLTNLMIRRMMETVVWSTFEGGSLTILSTFMEIVSSLCILLSGMNRCEQNYREMERIIRLIDDLIINKKTGSEEREALKDLKHVIMTRPVQFKAMSFYRLDYPCFVSVTSVIVTYTIILLQSFK